MISIIWILWLILFVTWLVRKKPFGHEVEYDFPRSGFRIILLRWYVSRSKDLLDD